MPVASNEVKLISRKSQTWVVFSACFVLIVCCRVAEMYTQSSSVISTHPEFETISVKPGSLSDPGGVAWSPGGRFTATDATLQQLLRFAYGLQDFQILGGPNWIDSVKFTIEATPPGTIQVTYDRAGQSVVALMVQSLLANRFKLAAHRVTGEGSIYELVVNKDGPKLKDSPNNPAGQVRIASGELIGTGAPMFLLVGQLSRQLGRPVVDKTGLTGKYDFAVNWTPDFDSPIGAQGVAGTTPINSDAPSIFTALQQLGLKLQSAKGPIDMLVIDHVEKPDSN
jgi:uncharacterized protein (TIGR03435 family)